MNSKVTKKTAWIIIISVIAFVIVAMVAIALGHTLYTARQEAEIVDFGSLELTDAGLVYYYADGIKSIDLAGAFKVSSGADFAIAKIKDEDGTVTKGEGKIIDLSQKGHRTAVINVVSADKKNTADYNVTFIPNSHKNNIISYDLSGGTITGDYLFSYSGNSDIVLPTPTKTYTSPATGLTYSYPFEGWYTTPDYAEGTEITNIPKGTDGEVALYAKFASSVIQGSRDGYQYVLFGYYPQERVTDYTLTRRLRAASSESASHWYKRIGYFD